MSTVIIGKLQQLLLHALCSLSGHINATHSVKLSFRNMQMAIQAAAFTPLCDDGKVGFSHVAHEQQDVDVAGLPAGTEMVEIPLSH